jgi:aminomethyltransferase
MDAGTRGRIAARGRDRARLLHNLTTNDIKALEPGAGCYAFVLNAQGRMQADVSVFCFAGHFLLETEPETRETVMRWIRRYIIADQVELEDLTDQTAELALEGPGAAAVLAGLTAPVPDAPYAHLPWGEATVARASLTGQPGFRLFLPAGARDATVQRLEAAGARKASDADARVVRIENGIPRWGDDLRDTTLVQESGQMHAVSFTKGCYLGQEIVERVRARGHVNRKLVRVEVDAAEPVPAGTKLSAGGAEAGEITSSVWSPRFGKVVALAYVRVPHGEPGTALYAGEYPARVIEESD